MKARDWFELTGGVLLLALLALVVWSFKQQQAMHDELRALVLRSRAAAPAPEQITRRVALEVSPAPAASADALRADLRAIVREELDAFAEASVAREDEEEAVPDDPESFDENVRQFERATALVRKALVSRVWGDEQAHEFRSIRSKLTPEQYDGLLRQILPAINSQEVRAEANGPLF
ncbi:MAG TPA: hypothetical protein VFZ53_26935 [Polyangiaceae bacterium]